MHAQARSRADAVRARFRRRRLCRRSARRPRGRRPERAAPGPGRRRLPRQALDRSDRALRRPDTALRGDQAGPPAPLLQAREPLDGQRARTADRAAEARRPDPAGQLRRAARVRLDAAGRPVRARLDRRRGSRDPDGARARSRTHRRDRRAGNLGVRPGALGQAVRSGPSDGGVPREAGCDPAGPGSGRTRLPGSDRRLHGGNQRVLQEGRLPVAGVGPQRRDRDGCAARPALRCRRRRRGAALGVLLGAEDAARRADRAAGAARPAPPERQRGARLDREGVRVPADRQRRGQRHPRRRQLQAVGAGRLVARRARADVERAPRRRQAVHDRQAADGGGAAARLLLSRVLHGGRPARRRLRRARRRARRHSGDPDRPRSRLRLERDLGRLGQHRRLRRDALRRRHPPLPLQGRVPRDDPVRRRPDPHRRPAGSAARLLGDRARARDRLRDRGRPAGRARSFPLDPRPRARERAPALPAQHCGRPLRPGLRPADARRRDDLQPLLRRSPGHRDGVGREAPAPLARGRPGLSDDRHRRARLAVASWRRARTRRRSTRRAARSSTGTTSRRCASAPPTTTGSTARSTARSSSSGG